MYVVEFVNPAGTPGEYRFSTMKAAKQFMSDIQKKGCTATLSVEQTFPD